MKLESQNVNIELSRADVKLLMHALGQFESKQHNRYERMDGAEQAEFDPALYDNAAHAADLMERLSTPEGAHNATEENNLGT
ncbi:hypothetical protein [Enteractinococcus coprophilus]|uniref:hypothetical protein n=1 Tax=Enteractinococcus coprophilus TaxID=1027633 RepID=UPI003667F949